MFIRSAFQRSQSRHTTSGGPATKGSLATTRRRSSAARRTVGWANCEVFEGRRLMSFSPVVSYPAGDLPQDVVTADFNRDGRLDLAVVDAWRSAVSVLPGNADGTFGTARTSATGAEPLAVAVGDFDADGNLDLVTANEYDVSVLPGNGDGTFRAPRSIYADDSVEPISVAVGDFNRDGVPDLGVTANSYDFVAQRYFGTANVLLGNGDGSFQAPVVNFLDWGVHTASVVADLDGDGVQDFAAANLGRSAVSVLLGDGQGNLLHRQASLPTGASPQAVTAGDVNGDLKTDLVTANGDGSVSVLLGAGANGFAAARNYSGGSGRDAAAAVVLADFNRDGKLDIAAGGSHVSILRGSGDGTFSAVEILEAGPGANGLDAGDFNGDGWLDVATANPGGGTASVLINDRSWPVTPPPSIFISDAAVTEGNTGLRNAVFTVTLSAPSDQPVTVRYATSDGTAAAGSDYQASAGTLTFAPGQTTATIAVPVVGDRLAEPNETFSVRLIDPSNAYIADDVGTGTIIDDEPRISINSVSKSEGNGKSTTLTFTVSLSAAYDQAVTVNYATANGTAAAGSDYTSKAGALTFAPGETSKTITVVVLGDKKREANETFFVDLLGASGNALVAAARGVGTIVNDD